MQEDSILGDGYPCQRKQPTSSRRRPLLQQSYDRIQDKIREGNHPEQETKRKKRAPEGAIAEAENKSPDPPQHKR